MPYVLIPDGHKLEKATKLQVDAVSSKRRHDDVVALLANPNTPLVLGGLVTAYFGVKLAEDIIKDIESRVGALSDDVKQGIKDTVNIKLPTFGAPAPTAPTLSDLITYIKAEIV
jgi:hypothetical protein